MTRTKRTFLYAGWILGILSSIFMLLSGVVFLIGAKAVITKDLFVESYFEDTKNYTAYDASNQITDNIDEVAYFVSNSSQNEKFTIKDIETSAKILKTVVIFLGCILVGLGIAEMAFGILVINVAAKGSNKLASIITLLILSAVTGNLLTMAFMIVGLCLKNKPEITIEPSSQALNS